MFILLLFLNFYQHNKAKEMNIQNIHNFYNSKIFKENGFKYDNTNKYILKVLRVISRK